MVETAESDRRRLVVYRALENLVSQSELDRAMDLWNSEFLAAPSFQPIQFLGRLSAVLDIKDRTSQIRNQLLRLMIKPLAELGSDPMAGMAVARSAAPVAARPRPAAPSGGLQGRDRVFAALLEAIIRSADRHTGLNGLMRDGLARGISSARVSASAVQQVSSWAATPDTFIRVSLQGLLPAEMAKVLDLIYVNVCDEIGPRLADRMLAAALREAEKLPEAESFPPRQLL